MKIIPENRDLQGGENRRWYTYGEQVINITERRYPDKKHIIGNLLDKKHIY